jgi:hypothetical protein
VLRTPASGEANVRSPRTIAPPPPSGTEAGTKVDANDASREMFGIWRIVALTIGSRRASG